MQELIQWAQRNGVTQQALNELFVMFNAYHVNPNPTTPKTSEGALQQQVRLNAHNAGVIAWRNNVGAATTDTGSHVRFGLANDSAKMNKHIKSSDLIGIKKVYITQEMVGSYIGQFWARECKRPGWHYTGTDREQAQLKYQNLVVSFGGDAKFITSIAEI